MKKTSEWAIEWEWDLVVIKLSACIYTLQTEEKKCKLNLIWFLFNLAIFGLGCVVRCFWFSQPVQMLIKMTNDSVHRRIVHRPFFLFLIRIHCCIHLMTKHHLAKNKILNDETLLLSFDGLGTQWKQKNKTKL